MSVSGGCAHPAKAQKAQEVKPVPSPVLSPKIPSAAKASQLDQELLPGHARAMTVARHLISALASVRPAMFYMRSCCEACFFS